MELPVYTLRRAARNNNPEWWQAACFATTEEGRISHFQKESETLKPSATFRGVYDDGAIMLRYEVEGVDAFASAERKYNGWVYKDSCCEFFVQPPRANGGYMNFEVNAAGVLHTSHITDPERRPGGFKDFRYVTAEDGAKVEIMRWRDNEPATPPCVEVVPNGSTSWGMAIRIPFEVLRAYVGEWREGEPWRANFYTCQVEGGPKYFVSWAPIPIFEFHSPQFFGILKFE